MMKNELYHHGILGQKWGIRRYQNEDGSYTTAGKERRSGTKMRGLKLSDRQKKVLKVGATITLAGLAAYGAYKISSSSFQTESDKLLDKMYKTVETERFKDGSYLKTCYDEKGNVEYFARNGRYKGNGMSSAAKASYDLVKNSVPNRRLTEEEIYEEKVFEKIINNIQDPNVFIDKDKNQQARDLLTKALLAKPY